jgi:hypothetical protein
MACPYFEPGERLPLASGSLGDLYSGHCGAVGSTAFEPDERTLSDRCNLGYARGLCPRFPVNGGADAVRFSVAGHDESGVRLLYSTERDHRPLASGALQYSVPEAAFLGNFPEALERLASAYVRSYLRRAR